MTSADITTVEQLVRQQLSQALGGGRGILEAAVPTVAFTISWLLTHDLRTSLGISLGLAVLLIVVRLVQRSSPDSYHLKLWTSPSSPRPAPTRA